MTLCNKPFNDSAEIQRYVIEFKGSEISRFKCLEYLQKLASNVFLQKYVIQDKVYTDSVLNSCKPQIENEFDVACFTSQEPALLIAVSEQSREAAENKINLVNNFIKEKVQTRENSKKQMEQNQDVEVEIYFDKFEKNPANYNEIEKKFRAND